MQPNIVFSSCGSCFHSGRSFFADDACESHGQIATCDGCGRREHIDLLDAKPSDGDLEGGDYDRLECIACYGPGWLPAVEDALAHSLCPDLSHRYVEHRLAGVVWC